MFMPRAIANAIGQVARRAVGKDWDIYAALLEHWAEIVGPEYAQATTPVKINFPHQPLEPRRRNGTLTVRLPRGLAMEFSFKAEPMKQRINNYFGYDAIGRIVFDPVYTSPPAPVAMPPIDPDAVAKLHEDAGTVTDSDLRAALESFGETVLKSSALK
jgi:hypothetical protein